MENKNEGNENKIILENFNCTMDKQGRFVGNKKQRLYRCCSNYALIVDNRLQDLWRKENPDSPEFTRYDRSFGKDPKSNHIMASFNHFYNVISIERLTSKAKIGKG